MQDHPVFDIRFYLQLFFLPRVLKREQAFTKLLAEVKFLLCRKDLLVFKLVEFQNICDQTVEPLRRAVYGSRVFKPLFFGKIRLAEQACIILNDRKRRFQFMRNI